MQMLAVPGNKGSAPAVNPAGKPKNSTARSVRGGQRCFVFYVFE